MTASSKPEHADAAAAVAAHLTPESGIIITIRKVKRSASSLFVVIYAVVLLPLLALISICKSNHAASPWRLLVLSGKKPRPTGNSLCKYVTVDTRRAASGRLAAVT
ncbi:hypothetical protein EYF80_008904 [Liparis tanakae]|uniref:Uncharacterized protein n=1 Tax=Liparis tanakae TaxID=230148 RepID=A0A4Z2ISB8_9TELE|nr:hypothetical protein EYF80_008904 [Liparis tanakae]